MSTYRDQLIFEALRHPASSKLRVPLYRKSKPRKIEQIANIISRRSQRESDAYKSSVYKGIASAAKRRADEKYIQNLPGTRHSTRLHFNLDDAPPIYKTSRGEYISAEQNARGARASRAGYFGSKLTTKNPKKQRKDNALMKMARTELPKSGYGEWSKEKLKEAYYDIINYLLNEGYANDFESADGIFQVMSDDWFNTLVETEVVAQQRGVAGRVRVAPTQQGGISIGPLRIGGQTVNRPVPGSFRAGGVSDRDAARYNNRIDNPNISAAERQRELNSSGHSGFIPVSRPSSIPDTGIPGRPSPGRASDQTRARTRGY